MTALSDTLASALPAGIQDHNTGICDAEAFANGEQT